MLSSQRLWPRSCSICVAFIVWFPAVVDVQPVSVIPQGPAGALAAPHFRKTSPAETPTPSSPAPVGGAHDPRTVRAWKAVIESAFVHSPMRPDLKRESRWSR